jgi:hypothetical protein
VAAFEYQVDGEVAADFFASEAFVRGLRGPVGSGKSVACCIELFRRAIGQAPSPQDGLRRTRWAVIRNTQPELKTTTIKTWLDWFHEDIYGKFNWSPPFTHHIRRGEIDCEVIFIALDKAEDVKKLLSLELTGAFINEAREVPKAILDAVTMRAGRYPSKRDGGCTWKGVIMDTNAPDEDHWWAIMSGDVVPPEFMSEEEVAALVRPAGWEFFSQPGAMFPVKVDGKVQKYLMSDRRENQRGIDDDYYLRMIAGKTNAWIDVYVCNRYGTLTDGKPVYPGFDRALHVAPGPLQPLPGHTIYCGIDFGLTPAALFGQKVRGTWRILREIVTTNMGMVRFSTLLHGAIAELGGEYSFWGDPTGDNRVGTDEDTAFLVLRRAGIPIRPTATNDPSLRIEAMTQPMERLVDKHPGLVIDPSCRNFIAGAEGGYHYKRMAVMGTERFETAPNKNRFSHVHDAGQYMMLGGGEGRALVNGPNRAKVIKAPHRFDVFAHAALSKRRKVGLKKW